MRTFLANAMRGVLSGGVAVLAGLCPADSHAQGPQAHQVATAGMQAPYSMSGGYMNAHGEPIIQPASYGAPYGPAAYGPACPPYGGDPYSGAMMNTEQSGPHYFDFSAEYLNYERDGSALGGSSVFSTFGFAGEPLAFINDPNNQAIMSDAIGGGRLDGYRLTGRLDVGALSVFEVSYSGLYEREADEAVAIADVGGTLTPGNANDDRTIFSVFSRFGTRTNPQTGVPGTAGPPLSDAFEETDDALEHRARFESEIHTAEATFRRYWVGYNPRISGTLLAGFRYTSLEETLGFFARSADGSINIDVEADNRLAGFQVGGDAWVTLLQGFRAGGEIKAGLYNNDFDISTSALASDGSPNSGSSQSGNQAAFLTEAKLMAVANLTACLSARGGYEVLYMNELALAGDNLLANPPYGGAAGGLVTDGEELWHGWHAGIEYIW